MADVEQRLVELEIKYTHQSDLIDQLSTELYKSNELIEGLSRRLKRVEQDSMELLNRGELPPNEKPPHY